MSVSKVCEGCGKTFEISDYKAAHGKGRFCSNECKRKEGGRRSTTHFKAGADNPSFTNGNRAFGKEDYAQRKIHKMVQNAVHAGEILPMPCEVCGATHDLHAHHDDYSKPLDVRWFCRTHHRLHHILNR